MRRLGQTALIVARSQKIVGREIVLRLEHVDVNGSTTCGTVAGSGNGLHIVGHRVIQRRSSVELGRDRRQCNRRGCRGACVEEILGDLRTRTRHNQTVCRLENLLRLCIFTRIGVRSLNGRSVCGTELTGNRIIAPIDNVLGRHIGIDRIVEGRVGRGSCKVVRRGESHVLHLFRSERLRNRLGQMRTIHDGVHHHHIGRNGNIQHILDRHLDVLIIDSTSASREIPTLGLHIVSRHIRNVHVDGSLLTTAVQVGNLEVHIQTTSVHRVIAGKGCRCVTRLVKRVAVARVSLSEDRQGCATRDGGTASVASRSRARTIIVTIGFRINQQVAGLILKRHIQVNIIPTRRGEMDALVNHQSGHTCLRIPIDWRSRRGQLVVIRGLHIDLDGNTICTITGRVHIQADLGDGAVMANFILTIENLTAGIAVVKDEGLRTGQSTIADNRVVDLSRIGIHIIHRVKEGQRSGIGITITLEVPRLVAAAGEPAKHALRDGSRQLGSQGAGSVVVDIESVLSHNRQGRLADGDNLEVQRVIVLQTVLRIFHYPHLHRVGLIYLNLVVGEIKVSIERECAGLMAVESVLHRLRDGGLAVDRVFEHGARQDILGTVVGNLHRDVLVAEVAASGRVEQTQQGHIVHVRRIHQSTNHKTTEGLGHVCAIGEVVEGAVTQRGLHLGGKIVTIGEHLDTHIHLVQVGQSEILNGDDVPSALLQGAEIHQRGGGDDIAIGIGHKGTHTILRIGNEVLVVVIFHSGHHQLVNSLDAHTRTDNCIVIARELAHSGSVGEVDDIVRHLHSPMGSIVGIQLVIAGADLHILDLQHIVLVTREGYHRLRTGSQRSYRQRVVILLSSTCHIQVNLDIILGKMTLVTHQCLHHILHLILGRSLTLRVDVRHSNIVVEEISQTDTVNVDVVAVLGFGVKCNIDTAGGYVVGKVIGIERPLRRVGRVEVTFQQSGGLTLRGQSREGGATIGGNLHCHTLLGAVGGVVVGEPNLQDGVHRVGQIDYRHNGTRFGVVGKRLRVEEETASTIHRSNRRIDTRTLLECPVTGTRQLLNGPGLLRTIAEVLLIVGSGRLQHEHQRQRIVGVVVVTIGTNREGEVNGLVHRDSHVVGHDLRQGAEHRDGAAVDRDRLGQVQRVGMHRDGRIVLREVEDLRALVGQRDRDIIAVLRAGAGSGVDQSHDGCIGGRNLVGVCTHIGQGRTLRATNIRGDISVTTALHTRVVGRHQRKGRIGHRRQKTDIGVRGGNSTLQLRNGITSHRLEGNHTRRGNKVIVRTIDGGGVVQIERIIGVIAAINIV